MSRSNRSQVRVQLSKFAASLVADKITNTHIATVHSNHGRVTEVIVDETAKKRKRWSEQVKRTRQALNAEA